MRSPFIFTALAFIIPPLAGAGTADFPRVFHITGIPALKRDQRVDISVMTEGLVFTHVKLSHRVPYLSIKQVLLLNAARNYEKTTELATIAGSALGVRVGALLILVKHKVDTAVIDYQNERGGRMGIVIQLTQGEGERFMNTLRDHGVVVVNPLPVQKTEAPAQPALIAEPKP
jgi:hypothetical protein